MRRASLVAIGFLIAARTVAAQSAGAVPASSPALVVVKASADSSIAADRATLYLAVDTHASTADDAGRDNARIQNAVMDALRRTGAPPRQISTTGFSVSPNMRSDGPGKPLKSDGYDAHNSVRLQIDSVDRIGNFIDAALAAGANRISGLTFDATGYRDARRAVLAQAVVNARADAEAMARAAGGSLGRLVEVSTEQPGTQVSAIRLSSIVSVGSEQTTDIAPHPIELSATVYARWEFVQKP